MIKSIHELHRYLRNIDELASSETALENVCVINYLKSITVDSIFAQIDPWLVVNDHTVLCVIAPVIERSVKGVRNELFTRYGIGVHHP